MSLSLTASSGIPGDLPDVFSLPSIEALLGGPNISPGPARSRLRKIHSLTL